MMPKAQSYNTWRFLFRISMLLAAIIAVQPAEVQSRPQVNEVEARLRSRLSAYLDAMQRGDFATASQYILPRQRNQFAYEVPKGTYLRWKIISLTFNKDSTECKSVATILKPMPPYGEEVDWPLHNEWVLSDGEWYLKIPWESGKNPILKMFNEQGSMGVVRSAKEPDPLKAAESAQIKPARIPSRITPDSMNPSIVHSGEKTVFRYSYVNDTDKPFKIVSVHADCHCTNAKQDFPEMAPGQTGIMEVTLDTFGLTLGTLKKEVLVQFSDREEPILLLLIVENQPNFILLPTGVDFGILAPGKVAEQTLRIANNSGKEVKLLSFLSSDPNLELDLVTQKLEAGAKAAFLVRYLARNVGDFIGNLMIRTDLDAEPLISLQVRGKVDR